MAGFNARFLCQILLHFLRSAAVHLLSFFRFVSACIFRLQGDGSVCLKNEEYEINVTETEPDLFPDEDVPELNSFESEEEAYACLQFKFPTYEEFREIQKASGNELETFPINEINEADSIGVTLGDEKSFSDGHFGKDENEEIGAMEFPVKAETETEQKEEEIKGNNLELLGESMPTDSNSDSDSSSSEHTNLMDHLVDSYRGGGFSDERFGEADENEADITEDYDDEEIFEIAELKNVEEHSSNSTDGLNSGPENTNGVELSGVPPEMIESDDDENELESLWEHQELVEQLKMELKKVKATGLPTILEESESPKIMDDLKPWKMDEFHREDCIGELHKFYKSYRERMRKFDIINYQKMYAMGVLQLRDPLQFMSEQKPSAPAALTSFLLQKLPVFRNKIHGSDPMKKFIQELQGDLEVVYVAQMCLSWEFLNWQYDKVLDLWDADLRGVRQYNEVAGEFQQFQVLLQRFVEDEPFQDQPRMQNYIRTRGVLRNLLQVPVVREDKRRGKRKDRQYHEYVITSDMLVEIVEESIRIFWRFVRADKDSTITAITGNKKMPEVSDPEDLKLFAETRKALLKKERKIRDLLRSENCVLRKIRRCREGDDDSDQVLYFFSQVDMKLVCRVLNMAKITRDQLVWCRKKLERIGFVDRKIHVEPAFLLFPS